MFDKIKNLAKSAIVNGEVALSRVVDKAAFKRVIEASYLIANADDDFDSDEKKAVSKIIAKELPQFKLNDILAEIKACDEKVGFDKGMATLEMLDSISKAKGTPEAEMIMRIVCYIGEADGSFDGCEKLVARDIAVRLDLPMKRYGL